MSSRIKALQVESGRGTYTRAMTELQKGIQQLPKALDNALKIVYSQVFQQVSNDLLAIAPKISKAFDLYPLTVSITPIGWTLKCCEILPAKC